MPARLTSDPSSCEGQEHTWNQKHLEILPISSLQLGLEPEQQKFGKNKETPEKGGGFYSPWLPKNVQNTRQKKQQRNGWFLRLYWTNKDLRRSSNTDERSENGNKRRYRRKETIQTSGKL